MNIVWHSLIGQIVVIFSPVNFDKELSSKSNCTGKSFYKPEFSLVPTVLY